jgi:2-oxoglutarate/2-oxoacid ferredoxin oxidoreductase subunit alpha
MKGIVFRIGGEGGEGVISTGELLTLACARAGYDIYAYKTFPAEIKGGYAMWQVRVKDELLLSQGDKVDVLICFNQEAYDKDIKDIADGGILLYDTDQCPNVKEDKRYKICGIPFTKISVEQIGSKRAKNVLILGVIAGLFDFPEDILIQMIKQKWAHKEAKVVEKNIEALKVGMTYVRENLQLPLDLKITKVKSTEKMVISGSDACALGCLAAGMRYYAGYPITPATEVMEWLAPQLPKVGGMVVQCEDEIASLASVLGASYAGKKAMTATSGPGVSLMCELIGLASMAELPCVIVDVQRGGPSTGMPTKTEQSDLNIALYASHGEAPRVVMALTSVEDAFYGMIRAFNIAERFQGPVLVLSDQYLAQRKASIVVPDPSKIVLEDRLQPDMNQTEKYKRYLNTDSGISPISIPGKHPFGYVATGIEHDETAKPGYTPALHTNNTQKRYRKLQSIVQESNDLVRYYGHEAPEIGIIGWGSTEGVIREAVAMAMQKGIKVAAIHPKILNPLPNQKISEFIGKVKEVIIPELNYTGQLASLLLTQHQFKPIRLNKYGGIPFTPQDILSKIEEVNSMTNSHSFSVAK